MTRTVLVSLKARGYEPRVMQTATRTLAAISEWRPGVVLLDLGLPDISGPEVLRSLRRWSDIPALIASARHNEAGGVNAPSEGVDGCVTKPFSMRELLARLHSTVRGPSKVVVEEVPGVASVDDHLMADLAKQRALVADELVHLTPCEWDILVYLVQHRDGLATKLKLLKVIWGDQYEKETNYLRVYIFQLRHKIEPQQAHNKYLRIEVGIGCCMVLDEE